MGQSEGDKRHGQLEVKRTLNSDVMPKTLHKEDAEAGENNGTHESLNLQTSGIEDVTIRCVYPECDVLVNDLAEHLENECLYRLEKCRFCKEQVSANVMKLHQSEECRAFPVELGKCGKSGIPQAKKEQFNVTLPLQRETVNFLLSRNVTGENRNCPENSLELKEEIAPSLKEVVTGNGDTRNTISRNVLDVSDQHEQRLNDLENKFAEHDLLLRENFSLRQDIRYLTDTLRDVSNKVDHIQRTLVFQKRDFDIFQENFNALQNEQINLQARFNRLLESPIPHGELARLNRSMEVIQERIVRLERHSRSYGGMLTDMANSVATLTTAVRHAEILGVDIL